MTDTVLVCCIRLYLRTGGLQDNLDIRSAKSEAFFGDCLKRGVPLQKSWCRFENAKSKDSVVTIEREPDNRRHPWCDCLECEVSSSCRKHNPGRSRICLSLACGMSGLPACLLAGMLEKLIPYPKALRHDVVKVRPYAVSYA